MSEQGRTSSSGKRRPGGSAAATTPGGTSAEGTLDFPMGGHMTDNTGNAGSTGMAETTGSSGMGGAGSGGDSATGTGAPVPSRSKPVAGSGSKQTGEQQTRRGDKTGGAPRPGAAGAREDSEAGGSSAAAGGRRGEFPAEGGSVGDVKVAEDILGSVLGDREPGEPDPLRPAGPSREENRGGEQTPAAEPQG
jgi:hypothetical protein